MPEPYVSLTLLKRARGIKDGADDELLTQALNAASRRIDARCGRRFWLDEAASARTFGATGRTTPDGRLLIDDIGDTTGLVVETGSTSAGWTESTGYELGPANSPDQGWPYTELVGDWWWSGTVRVTARWGWPAVPEDIAQATLLLASRLFLRKNSPEGVIASADFGSTRVSRWDPDIDALISPYIQPKNP